jgi:prepilin-type N-terminal cleavage/methylation domain-containing protein
MRNQELESSTQKAQARGFTLIELLASMAILGLIVVILFGVFQQTSKAWLGGERHVETFTQARAVLDLMSRDLSQAIATDKIPFFAQQETTPLGKLPAANQISLHLDNLAFIASVGDSSLDGMDLVEIVYRLNRAPNGQSEDSGAVTAPFFFTNSIPVSADYVPPFSLIRRASAFAFSGVATDCRNYGNFAVPCGTAPWDFYGPPLPNPAWPETSDRTRTAVLVENVISLQFQFQDAASPPNTYSHWNSTTVSPAWQNELANPVGAAGPNMQNRAPAVVIITMSMLDSKAATRYSIAADPDAKKRIYEEAKREFTTTVAIPNRQP